MEDCGFDRGAAADQGVGTHHRREGRIGGLPQHDEQVGQLPAHHGTHLHQHAPECLEYVVVHELCHLREANHGPAFHGLLDAYMPDWKSRRAKLR